MIQEEEKPQMKLIHKTAGALYLESSEVERFHSFYRGGDGCWEWRGSLCDGYGRLTIVRDSKQFQVKSNRLAWTIFNGEIPKGLSVLHTCDNRRCVRTEHLFLGTQQDNMEDMVKKGRVRHGNAHPCAKLTDDQVAYIRMVYDEPSFTAKMLSEVFGVTAGTIRGFARPTGRGVNARISKRGGALRRNQYRVKHVSREDYRSLLEDVKSGNPEDSSKLAVKYSVPVQYVYNLRYRLKKGLIS